VAGNLRRERQLSTIPTWGFIHLAVVLFWSDYSIERASLIPVEVAREAATDDLHVRGNRIMAVDVFLDGRDVQDITELVAAALDELDSEFV
jgi:hypothetical protein